jgi:hypothetical protein
MLQRNVAQLCALDAVLMGRSAKTAPGNENRTKLARTCALSANLVSLGTTLMHTNTQVKQHRLQHVGKPDETKQVNKVVSEEFSLNACPLALLSAFYTLALKVDTTTHQFLW